MDRAITKVIDGLKYNTATATKICTYEPGGGRSDFKFECTALFRTPRGRFFLAGFGNAMSRWSERSGNNCRTAGEGLTALDVDAARSFAERHADADTIAKFFKVEDA